ncbi:DUF2637 domain-containing protein (plasmid) [Mycolicibacterium aubagnense]|uniref:DUF2637 domain-containing protein n=1 Tax=Mycolicibacterium aubagnense TaxID=319707 RepID=UPI0013F59AFF|nr:DUF2637 domain-containing protein [Mycolicibacterium aubagnense]WGI36058.1 DUF2637 domain-containing protein [Mycolicibacterium aubagnense]
MTTMLDKPRIYTDARTPNAALPRDRRGEGGRLSAAWRSWRRNREGMQAPPEPPLGSVAAKDAERTRAVAVRFFWAWLALSTTLSLAGNFADSWLTAPPNMRILASVAALVPPTILFGSTHSVACLIKAGRVGYTFWVAASLTTGVAVCAFILSYDKMRHLVIMLGTREEIAGLWPVAVDLSIVNATIALLSLSMTHRKPAAPAERAPGAEVITAAAAPQATGGDPLPQMDIDVVSLTQAIRRDHGDSREIAALSDDDITEVLGLLMRGESQRGVNRETGLHHRKIRAVQSAAQEATRGQTGPWSMAPSPAETEAWADSAMGRAAQVEVALSS